MTKHNRARDESNRPIVKKLYWGQTAYRKLVHQNQKSFEEFSDTLAQPPSLGLTHAEYHDSSKKAQSKAKDGLYWTPCSFTAPERNAHNAGPIELIALDIDGGEFAAQLSPDYMVDLDMFGEFPFSWILHSTTSHTPEKPRYRVIIDADGTIDPIFYPACVLTIAKLVGLKNVNSESQVVCQPMYVPRIPSDLEYVFACQTEGRPFTAEDIDNTIELSPRQSTTSGDDGDIGSLENLIPPSEEEESIIIDALSHIDPSCSRDQWVKICCGLKHQFQDDPERGYEIFDEWSSDGDEYQGQEDTQKQWDYEKSNPDRQPATIGTVFHYAKEGGWKRSKATGDDGEYHDPYDDLKGLTVEQILGDKCKELQKAKLGQALRVSTLAAMKKRLAELSLPMTITELKARTKPQHDKSDYAWLKDWVFVTAETPYYLHTKGKDSSKPVRAFNEANEHRCPVNDEGVVIKPHYAAKRIVGVPSVTREVYRPDKPAGIIKVDGAFAYNIYNKPKLKASKEHLEDAQRILNQIVNNTTDDPQERQMVWDYLTHLVQKPHIRINWALLLQGVEGTGKTMIFLILEHLLGKTNTTKIDGSVFLDKWNEYMGKQTLLWIDEIRVPEKSKYAVLDKFKTTIGNPTMPRQERFKGMQDVDNFMSTMLATNYLDAIPLGKADRRIAVAFSHLTTEDLQTPTMKAFFTEFYARRIELGPAFLYILKKRKISGAFDAGGHAPMTISKTYMQELSKSDLQDAIETIIDDPRYPLVTDKALSLTALCNILEEDYPEEYQHAKRYMIRKTLMELQYLNYQCEGKKYRYFHKPTLKQHPIWIQRRFRGDPMKELKPGFDADPFEDEL